MRILFSLLALLVLQFDGLFAMHSDLQGLSPSETNKMYKSKLLYSNVLERVINNSVPTITLVEGMHADLVGKNPAQQNVLYRDVVSKIDALKQKIASEGLPLPSEADYLYSSPSRMRLGSSSFTASGTNPLTVDGIVPPPPPTGISTITVPPAQSYGVYDTVTKSFWAVFQKAQDAYDYARQHPGLVVSSVVAGAAGGFALGRATKK